jgi:transposase
MVDAILFLARTGCQWRYLPDRFGAWGAVWQQWRRWRANGVWAKAMTRLARHIRVKDKRDPMRSMVVIDAQTVRGGRAGPTFHEAGGRGGRTNGTKRSILIDRLGLPIAARVDSAKPHDVTAGRLLIHAALPNLPRVSLVLADRGYRALDKAAQRHHARFEVRSRPPNMDRACAVEPPSAMAPLGQSEQEHSYTGRQAARTPAFHTLSILSGRVSTS